MDAVFAAVSTVAAVLLLRRRAVAGGLATAAASFRPTRAAGGAGVGGGDARPCAGCGRARCCPRSASRWRCSPAATCCCGFSTRDYSTTPTGPPSMRTRPACPAGGRSGSGFSETSPSSCWGWAAIRNEAEHRTRIRRLCLTRPTTSSTRRPTKSPSSCRSSIGGRAAEPLSRAALPKDRGGAVRQPDVLPGGPGDTSGYRSLPGMPGGSRCGRC